MVAANGATTFRYVMAAEVPLVMRFVFFKNWALATYRAQLLRFPLYSWFENFLGHYLWFVASVGPQLVVWLFSLYLQIDRDYFTPKLQPPSHQWVLQTGDRPELRKPRSRKNSWDNLPEHLAQELDEASKKVSPKTMHQMIRKCVRKHKLKDYQFEFQTDAEPSEPTPDEVWWNQMSHVERNRLVGLPDDVSSDSDSGPDPVDEVEINSWQIPQTPAPDSFQRNTSELSRYWAGANGYATRITSFIGKFVYGVDPDWVVKLTEDCFILARQLIKAGDMEDRVLAVTAFVKLQTNKSLTSQVGEQLMSFLKDVYHNHSVLTVQTEDVLKLSRNLLDKYDEARHSKLWKKTHRFLMYAISMSLFDKAGIPMDRFAYGKMEKEALKKDLHMGPDFIYTCLDTVLFICERGQQIYLNYQKDKTVDMSILFHSGEEYNGWFNRALELKRQSIMMTNPEAHGLNIFDFIANLESCIEQGNAILKHTKATKSLDARLYGKTLEDLKLINAEYISKRSAMKDRKAPFSLLIHGPTSVNKSGFTKLLYYHYGKLFGLDTSSEFKYTRNSIDNFWVNFNTYQWCVQLDDIGFMQPTAAPQGDPTLMEMLQVINNVPFVPIQAALEDKGRTPLLSRLVLATTNTMHLNLNAYFSCPAAIARRLPFVISLSVKDEFKQEDGRFNTDEARLYTEAMEEGKYPDFWNIQIFKVEVQKARNPGKDRDCANYIPLVEFTDIYKFIQWYSEMALAYELTQDSAMMADTKMNAAYLCNACKAVGIYTPCSARPGECLSLTMQAGDALDFTCYRPAVYNKLWNDAKVYIQREARAIAAEKWEEERLRSAPMWLMFLLWWCYTHIWGLHIVIDCLLGKRYVYDRLKGCIWHEGFGRRFMRRLGSRVAKKIGTRSFLLKIAAVIVAGIALKKCYDFFSTSHGFEDNKKKKRKAFDMEKLNRPVEDKLGPVLKSQGVTQSLNVNTIGRAPKVQGDEKPNPWYKEDYETTSFEVSPKSISWKALPRPEVEKQLLRNIVALSVILPPDIDPEQKENYPVRAFCLGGQTYITNNHALPQVHRGHKVNGFTLVVRMLGQQEGVTGTVKLTVTQDMIMRFKGMDLACLTLKGLPPRKKRVDYFPSSSMRGSYQGFYVGRDDKGQPFTINADNIHLEMGHVINDLSGKPLCDDGGSVIPFNLWISRCERPTVSGECGSVLVAMTPMGPVLMGIHNAGSQVYPDMASSLPIYREFAERLLEKMEPFVVQSGSPMLSTKTIQHQLDVLHKKSPLRYIEEGTALCYGSLNVHQAHMHSRVYETLTCEAMKKRGYEMKWAKPHMDGWRPKRVQLLEMVKPASKINPSLLEQVKQSFIKDILSSLTPEDLETVHVYDAFTAVNGAQGVAFVDAMKRSTSAGFPWKTTKKKFFEHIPPERGLDHPIKFNDEVMERVDAYIKTYLEGYRAYPVSDACFKDEAVKQAKRDAYKTRIFAAHPMDHSIVARMYTLGFTRLFYKHHLLFEAAPGVRANTAEWGVLYEYLTQHGKDRIAAGDYAFYDKSMFSLMIQAAFDIIIAVCEAAGYSEEELRVLYGIKMDAAFPLYNFFGDLIEFLGTLPSGHPLTVVLNSLANCLYMRYCYASVSPSGTADDFKKHVALMTYGDDNIMGISTEAPWFNHTAIQNTLASIGITYTMADKEQESIPYIHIDDCTFLKRSWRWDADLCEYVGPLPEDSIAKSLMIGVESKSETRQNVAISNIANAMREYFLFGRELFEERKRMLEDIVMECNLQHYVVDSTFPSWEQLVEAFDEERASARDNWR